MSYFICHQASNPEFYRLDFRKDIHKSTSSNHQYLELFGRVLIGVYRLPDILRSLFIQYLDSTRTALRRSNHRPIYLWMYDEGSRSYLLILLSNAFPDMGSAFEQIERIWRLYSPYPIQSLTSCIVTQEKEHDVLDYLKHIMNRIQEQASQIPHQHRFGASLDLIRE